MKKIINGKVYDTTTAKELGSWESTPYVRDFSRFVETLYQKRTGEFFIHGVGGPSSRYAVSAGQNCWDGGEKIVPLSYDAAREWAEEHLDADDYEAIFGEVCEDDSRVTVTLSLSASAVESAKRAASKAGIRLSAYIGALVID